MSFASIFFLFFFFPIFILCYYLPERFLPNKKILVQNIVIMAGSIIFYAVNEKWFTAVLLFLWIVNYLSAICLERFFNIRICILIVALVINIGVLGLFKYSKSLLTPVGLSFFIFQSLSYVLDVYMKKYGAEHNIIKVGIFFMFFPTVLCGPIIRFNDFVPYINNRTISEKKIYIGIKRLTKGLIKKVLIADSLALMSTRIYNYIEGGYATSLTLAWLGAIVLTLEIYYDFCGYSDMAIGVSNLLGFEISENFNYPYIASTVKDFWKRWHISLSTWLRDYVYIPLGGNRQGVIKSFANLLIVWIITGIWHGTGWTFFVWGMMYFFVLSLERLTGYGRKWQLPGLLTNIYTMLVVIIGWVIFRSNNLTEAYRFIRRLLGLGTIGIVDDVVCRFAATNWELLLISLIFIFPNKWKKHIPDWLEDTVLAVTLPVIVIYLVKAGFSPFIYFKF